MAVLTLGPNNDQPHPRVIGATGVHAVTQVTEPGAYSLAVGGLEAGVLVGDHDGVAGDVDPRLRFAVLEGQVDFLARVQVGELFAVCVGEEEEVGAGALGNCHGAADGLHGGTRC